MTEFLDAGLRDGRLDQKAYQDNVDDLDGQLREPLRVTAAELQARQRVERETSRVALAQMFAHLRD